MDILTCAAARPYLPAFYDGELAGSTRRALVAHLADCRPCRAEADELRLLGDAVRAAARRADPQALSGLSATVVGQVAAEREQSLPARAARLFEDLHLVWAGLAAAAGTTASVLIMCGLLYFGASVRPDSLSGIISAMAAPGSNANPVQPHRVVQLPSVYPDGFGAMLVPVAPGDDLVLAVSAVVTREGRVVDLYVLRPTDRDRARLLGLLDAASAARFQPARIGEAPVAVNVVWLLARTTVRGRV